MFKHHFISGLITPAAIAIILHLTPPPDVLQVDNDGQVTINGCFFNNTMLGVYGGLQVFDDLSEGIFLNTDSFSLSEGASEDPVYNYSSSTTSTDSTRMEDRA